MGDFCSQNTETITDLNYLDQFSSSAAQSCLPNGGTGFTINASSNGLIDKNVIDAHVVTLLSRENAVPPATQSSNDLNPASTYARNSNKLRNNITSEYCFYYKRYMYILQQVLNKAATSGLNIATNPAYNKLKQNAQDINSKLNQILQIMQGVINSRSNSLNNYYGLTSGVNALNSELDTARESLDAHMTALQQDAMENDIRASMIDYKVEKNSSSRNMLAIYGFMNIVAASMLFYLYRTM